MSGPSLKLTAYFAERHRTGSRFLADSMLDLFAEHHVATSVMLRGISGFGGRHIIRSDESLTLSEDPPVAITAVDGPEAIGALAPQVAAMTSSGLITVERARLLDIAIAEPAPPQSDSVKLTVYVGRNRRVRSVPLYQAVCDVLHLNGFAGVAVLLGVDGTVHGRRRRAHFFGGNADVPMMIIGFGSAGQVRCARAELASLLPDPLTTVERVQLCKNRGALLARPAQLPEFDRQGRPLWQKIMVLTSEADRYHGSPVHRALVRRLWESRAVGGATVLRGVWGYHGDQKPHGDKLIQLGRQVPVLTVIIGPQTATSPSFEIVDEITGAGGLVTAETVPAGLSIVDGELRGSLELADFRC